MDAIDIKVAGHWTYRYRVVDRDGYTIDFLLRAKSDSIATRRLPARAIDLHGMPEKIGTDKSGANTTPVISIHTDSGADIEMHQIKIFNNIVEQIHLAICRSLHWLFYLSDDEAQRFNEPHRVIATKPTCVLLGPVRCLKLHFPEKVTSRGAVSVHRGSGGVTFYSFDQLTRPPHDSYNNATCNYPILQLV